jgi:transposase
MAQKAHIVGIDVAKDELAVHLHPQGVDWTFGNDEAGWEALHAVLAAACTGTVTVAYEPTGGYERGMVRHLRGVGYRLRPVVSLRVRQFARSQGWLAKTDRLDARTIALYATTQANRPAPPVAGPAEEKLRELSHYRRQLVTERVRLTNQMSHLENPELRQISDRRLALVNGSLKHVERMIQGAIDAEPELARRAAIVGSVGGVGAVSVHALLADMPELGRIGHKQAAALLGVAPMANDSGNQSGRRFIMGGRKHVRCVLYMAALAAVRQPGDLQDFHQRLITMGKSNKQALTAVMRKMIVLINTLLRQDRLWQPVAP